MSSLMFWRTADEQPSVSCEDAVADLASRLAAAGVGSLRFDFSGNGASDGAFRFANLADEARGAWQGVEMGGAAPAGVRRPPSASSPVGARRPGADHKTTHARPMRRPRWRT